MSNILKVGIAGYGVVGNRRRFFIDKHTDLKLVAVCDRKFVDQPIPDDNICYYTDYRNILDHDIDLLFVCMTNDIAPEVTVAGLNKGVHVFCEKPPGRNLDDVIRVMESEKLKPDLKLKYGFNHRYHDSIRDAIEIVRTKQLGDVINMRGVYGKSKLLSFDTQSSQWRTKRSFSGGGILLDQGIHMVDMMRLFAGEFAEVYSFVSNDYWGHDVEDNAYALMRTGDGIVAMLHSSATEWRHRFRLEITLARGMIILSGILSGSKSYGDETLKVVYSGKDDRGEPREVVKCYSEDNSWRDEINEFVDAILNDKKIMSGSSTDALKTMHLVFRIYCADDNWRNKYNLSDTILK
ncbi:MAG TPA: oxidoreductase [Chloroflexi bacterium]|nr:oxidoreductase [Chloroflexota bacterium]|tara:strand:- start:140 stop:1189 length:1050 start_codon:yes stop_codon:yes gene_type:complete